MSGDETLLSCPWHVLYHNLLEKLMWARGLIQAQCRRNQPVVTSGAPFCSAVLQREGVQVTCQRPTMMKNASHSGIGLISYPQASSWFMGNTTFPFGLRFCSLDDASFACWMSAFLPVIGTWGHGDVCSVYSATLLMSPVWFWVVFHLIITSFLLGCYIFRPDFCWNCKLCIDRILINFCALCKYLENNSSFKSVSTK